jgi:hypothetical protein
VERRTQRAGNSMKQSAFDSWLSSQDDQPVHFVFHPTNGNYDNYDWSVSYSVIDGSCSNCDTAIGINSDGGSSTNYWQVDIDGEQLLCDECYNTAVITVDEPLMCCCDEGRCEACQIHGETK